MDVVDSSFPHYVPHYVESHCMCIHKRIYFFWLFEHDLGLKLERKIETVYYFLMNSIQGNYIYTSFNPVSCSLHHFQSMKMLLRIFQRKMQFVGFVWWSLWKEGILLGWNAVVKVSLHLLTKTVQ